jgi:glucosamine 6-phosphate synthetase-like amidotransferase/phosphosugar isomerase protein
MVPELRAELMTRLLSIGEARGRHATGVAIVDETGEAVVIKRPERGRLFVTRPEVQTALREPGARIILGHNRFATRGHWLNPDNNHPIIAGTIIGTHNGTIDNADKLFRKHRLTRRGEVDSELIFRLAEKSLTRGRLGLLRFARYTRQLSGSLTVAMINLGEPGQMVMVKGDQPLTIKYSSSLDALAYASTEMALDYGLKAGADWRVVPMPYMTLAIFKRDNLSSPEYRAIEYEVVE